MYLYVGLIFSIPFYFKLFFRVFKPAVSLAKIRLTSCTEIPVSFATVSPVILAPFDHKAFIQFLIALILSFATVSGNGLNFQGF